MQLQLAFLVVSPEQKQGGMCGHGRAGPTTVGAGVAVDRSRCANTRPEQRDHYSQHCRGETRQEDQTRSELCELHLFMYDMH